MKPCNVVKSFESGWIVGLSDNNHVMIETPEGSILQPYEGPGHKMFGTTIDNKTVSVDEQVAVLVRQLWKKKHEAELLAQAAQEDEIEKLARELTGEDDSNPSLDDLGFDSDDSVHVEDI